MDSSRIVVGMLVATSIPICALAHNVEVENKLVSAASEGNVRELARIGKQSNVDFKTTCALMWAVRARQVAAAKYLVKQGADPNLGSCHGPSMATAYEAARSGDRELLKFLVDHGADVNAESPEDSSIVSTPLILAVYYGDLNAARLLIEFGADVNRVSIRGNTALHQAIRYAGSDGPHGSSVAFVELLLKNEANPDIKDGVGLTARQFAKSHPLNEISFLIEHAKPLPVKTKSLEPTYNYTLDPLNAEVIERLLKFPRSSIRETNPSSGLLYYEGLAKARYAECKHKMEFLSNVPELRLLVSICGSGPFDENNIDETVAVAMAPLNMFGNGGDSEKRKKSMAEQFVKSRSISKTKRSISFLLPLIGHGVEFLCQQLLFLTPNFILVSWCKLL